MQNKAWLSQAGRQVASWGLAELGKKCEKKCISGIASVQHLE